MSNTTHKTRMVHIRLTDDRVRQLKVRAAMEDSSITKLVEQAVDTVYFADVPAKPNNNNNNTKPPKVNGRAEPSKARPPTTAPAQSSRPEFAELDEDLILEACAGANECNVADNPFV